MIYIILATVIYLLLGLWVAIEIKKAKDEDNE